MIDLATDLLDEYDTIALDAETEAVLYKRHVQANDQKPEDRRDYDL